MLSQFNVALQDLQRQLALEKQAVATADLPPDLANVGDVAEDLQTQLTAVQQELVAEQQRHRDTRQTAAGLKAQLHSPCVLKVNLTSIMSAYVCAHATQEPSPHSS